MASQECVTSKPNAHRYFLLQTTDQHGTGARAFQLLISALSRAGLPSIAEKSMWEWCFEEDHFTHSSKTITQAIVTNSFWYMRA